MTTVITTGEIVKKTFQLTGMSCVSCASSIESTLKSQLGVIDAAVNFASSSVLLEYDKSVAGIEMLKQAVQGIGYDLIIPNQQQDKLLLVETIQKKELVTLKHRTLWAIVLSVPLVTIAMFFMELAYSKYIMWALATPILFVFGQQFFINAWKQARHKKANMDTLVALSTSIAYLFSVLNTLYPQYLSQRGLEADVYFEAAGVIIAFILIGKLLEDRAKSNTSTAIKKLMGIQPKMVVKIAKDGSELVIPIAEVLKEDILIVKPGDKIPVDGELTNGSSYVDESTISGEPIPVEKKTGDKVYAGTLNQKGSFQLRAVKVGEETVFGQIIKMVQEAQGSKAPVQKLVDKIAGIFVPIVIGLAILSLIIWIVTGGEYAFTHGLLAMVTVLVIACPCALGLATPTAIMVGVGKAAENGILIKDAESLELAHKINAIILDKTGTITVGKPIVSDFLWGNNIENKVELQSILYSMEASSEHPLASAITDYLKDIVKQKLNIEQFESITGKGARSEANGKKYFVGNRTLMDEQGIKVPQFIDSKVADLEQQAKTIIYFSENREAKIIIAIADKIKDNSAKAVYQLRKKGIEVYMLTGDNEQTAKTVAEQVGIKHYRAQTLPADKAEFAIELQQQGEIVAMVGDGINDSHALAQADVSIAMGKGSDIAMDVAKMTIISSDLLKIPQAIELSGKTVRTIKQNLFWAFIYNIIGIPIAAGILYPLTGFLLNPMIAGAAMALSSVSVVSNSLRLKFINF